MTATTHIFTAHEEGRPLLQYADITTELQKLPAHAQQPVAFLAAALALVGRADRRDADTMLGLALEACAQQGIDIEREYSPSDLARCPYADCQPKYAAPFKTEIFCYRDAQEQACWSLDRWCEACKQGDTIYFPNLATINRHKQSDDIS